MMGLTGEIGTEAGEPTTMTEALSASDAVEWRQAMEEELHGLPENEKFQRRRIPSNTKPTKARFVYKLKRRADGEIERYKAHLVARGSTQRPGGDFFETFSSVIGFDVVRTVRAISAMRGWNLRALSFKQAYLNAALLEEVWLELADGSIVRTPIYERKQSALAWCTLKAGGRAASTTNACTAAAQRTGESPSS